MSVNRIQKELKELQEHQITGFELINYDNQFQWLGIILPNQEPYLGGAFKVQIDFPDTYPFAPPKVTLLTKIYHPNIEENGKICFEAITAENWKPGTKIKEVNEPNPMNAMRAEVANELLTNRPEFMKRASAYTSQFAPMPEN